jgi:hypothetical protein
MLRPTTRGPLLRHVAERDPFDSALIDATMTSAFRLEQNVTGGSGNRVGYLSCTHWF